MLGKDARDILTLSAMETYEVSLVVEGLCQCCAMSLLTNSSPGRLASEPPTKKAKTMPSLSGSRRILSSKDAGSESSPPKRGSLRRSQQESFPKPSTWTPSRGIRFDTIVVQPETRSSSDSPASGSEYFSAAASSPIAMSTSPLKSTSHTKKGIRHSSIEVIIPKVNVTRSSNNGTDDTTKIQGIPPHTASPSAVSSVSTSSPPLPSPSRQAASSPFLQTPSDLASPTSRPSKRLKKSASPLSPDSSSRTPPTSASSHKDALNSSAWIEDSQVLEQSLLPLSSPLSPAIRVSPPRSSRPTRKAKPTYSMRVTLGSDEEDSILIPNLDDDSDDDLPTLQLNPKTKKLDKVADVTSNREPESSPLAPKAESMGISLGDILRDSKSFQQSLNVWEENDSSSVTSEELDFDQVAAKVMTDEQSKSLRKLFAQDMDRGVIFKCFFTESRDMGRVYQSFDDKNVMAGHLNNEAMAKLMLESSAFAIVVELGRSQVPPSVLFALLKIATTAEDEALAHGALRSLLRLETVIPLEWARMVLEAYGASSTSLDPTALLSNKLENGSPSKTDRLLLTPSRRKKEIKLPLYGLANLLKLQIDNSAEWLTWLIKMSVDEETRSIENEIHNAIARTLLRLNEVALEAIASNVCNACGSDTTMQARLATFLSGTLMSHILARSFLKLELSGLEAVLDLLNSEESIFHLTPDTDYNALYHSSIVLDCAIPDSRDLAKPAVLAKGVRCSPTLLAITQAIRQLESKIEDFRSGSLYRTRTKDVLQRLFIRLDTRARQMMPMQRRMDQHFQPKLVQLPEDDVKVEESPGTNQMEEAGMETKTPTEDDKMQDPGMEAPTTEAPAYKCTIITPHRI